MPGSKDEPRPITVRPAPGGLGATSQERVALALTLMTKFSLDGEPAERAVTAAGIAETLQALACDSELTPELQRLCGRLQRIWAAVEREPK